MSDAIAFCEPVKCGNVCGTVVCNDLFYGSPSAQDIFEDEGAEGAGGLCAKCAPFGPSGERAAGLHDVAVSSGGWHKHGVNVYFVKEGGRSGDGWRDSDFGCLVDLTLVACCDVLFDVEGDRGSPEAIEEGAQCRVVAFVSEVVVGFV